MCQRIDPSCGGWGAVEQRFDRAAGAAAGAEFEHLAGEYHHCDHPRSFKVDADLASMFDRAGEQVRRQHLPRY